MNTPFISRLAQHITANFDLKKQNLTIVFPNKRAAFYLRSEFKRIINDNIWLPQMLSIEEAVTQWSGITLVDNLDLLFELIDIDAELNSNNPGNDTNLRIFGSQAAQMAKDFDEIDQYDVNAEELFNFIYSDKELQIWDFDEERRKEKEQKYLHFFRSLYKYYKMLRERLTAQGKGYYGMITLNLAHDDTKLFQAVGDSHIIFAGFNALTRTEETIIDKLVKYGKAEVIFDYDRYYIEDENNEAGLFARRYQGKHEEWMVNGICERLLKEEKHIHIVSCSGSTIQAKALQNNLTAINDKDATVVLADENLLIPVLNSIPDQETYSKFKVSMGYPLQQTPVNQLIKEYFILQKGKKIKRKTTANGQEKDIEGWYLWPILRIMDLELVKIILDQKENQAFTDWKIEAVKQGTFIFEEKHLNEFSKFNDLKTFLKLILKPSETPEQMLGSIRNLLCFVAQKTQKQSQNGELLFLLNQVSETGKIINRLDLIIKQHNKYVTEVQDVELLFKMVSTGNTIKLNSTTTDGLQIMGLLETRNLDFNKIHVLSVNEGILPAEKSQGSFIPYFIRKEFGLPGYFEKQAVFAYHFYHLLQSANDIYLYYTNVGNNSGGEPSRFILQILHEMRKSNANIHITKEPFAGQAANTGQKAPLSIKKDASVVDALKGIICSSKGLSPTAISTYINCPFMFCLKYIKKIEDNSVDEDTGSNITGSIIHKTFESLFQPYLPNDGQMQIIDKELFINKIKPNAEKELQKAIEEKLPGGLSDIGYNYMNKLALHKWLHAYLDYTEKCLGKAELIMLKLESNLSSSITINGLQCNFAGYADRIDKYGNTYRVIDYKSGKVDDKSVELPYRQQGETDINYLKRIPEKALQLLLYKYFYLKKNPNIKPQDITAALHSLRHPKKMQFGLVKTHPSSKGPAEEPFLLDETFTADMEKLLTALIKELLDTEIPFNQCEEKQNGLCGYCDFCEICRRERKK